MYQLNFNVCLSVCRLRVESNDYQPDNYVTGPLMIPFTSTPAFTAQCLNDMTQFDVSIGVHARM